MQVFEASLTSQIPTDAVEQGAQLPAPGRQTNTLVSSDKSVLFRCDADHQIGMGHLIRCLALAEILSGRYGFCCGFLMARRSAMARHLGERGYKVITGKPKGVGSYFDWLADSLRSSRARVLISDVRDDLSEQILRRLRATGTLIVVLDDTADRRLSADLVFYPPLPQLQKLDWTGFSGTVYSGWEYILLRSQFAKVQRQETRREMPRLLITMGGSDPAGLTLKAIRALQKVTKPYQARIVCGPAFADVSRVRKLISSATGHCELIESPSQMAPLMGDSDLAIASFGGTAYELAACGVPSILLSLSSDHYTSSWPLVEAGAAISLGHYRRVSQEKLAATVTSLLEDRQTRRRMSKTGRQLVDQFGAFRVATLIHSALTQKGRPS